MPEYSLVRNYLDRIHDNSDFGDDETNEYQACLAQKTLKQKSTNLFINKAEEWPAWLAWQRSRESSVLPKC
jgi:arginyl-tRNA--protein-N-Asp/Glu arginylyltransferase